MICIYLSGQETFILHSGATYEGKLVQMNDSIVVFITKIKDKDTKLTLPRDMIKEIINKANTSKIGKKVAVTLNDNKRVIGIVDSEDEDQIVLSKTHLTKGPLIIKKSRIVKIKSAPARTTFIELGFLKGGALIGAEFDFALSEKSSFFAGGGYKGLGGGINMFFSEKYEGAGIKLVFLSQGWGETYAGSLGGLSLFYKMTPGISLDLGLAKVLSRGNYNYGNYDIILNYSVGIRF